ncbi:MAG: asparagine synthase-related protein [Candidatus Nanopelagicales bacterium]
MPADAHAIGGTDSADVLRVGLAAGTPLEWGWSPDGESWRSAAAALATGDDPVGAPDAPWTVVRRRGDSLAAAVNATAQGGLYWSIDQCGGNEHLLFSNSLKALVRARRSRTTLNADYLRSYAVSAGSAQGSPFVEVHRIAPGTTAVWHPGVHTPQISVWCGPEAWPEPDLSGPQVPGMYLRTFDSTIDELVGSSSTPLAAAVSGGLDSTFMAASLARHCSKSNPLLAFCHSPDPDAQLGPFATFDPNDYPVAEQLARAYPGRIEVVRVVTRDALSLDAAAAFSERTWLPTYSPSNQVWLDDIAERAAAAGADRLFHGANGNPAYSYSHPYAARHYLDQRDWGSLAALARPYGGSGQGIWRQFRSRVAAPLASPLRVRQRQRRASEFTTGLGFASADGDSTRAQLPDRSAYLKWLGQAFGTPAAMGPAGWPVAMLDPFTGRAILELAARMTPLEWSTRGPGDRGYARMLAAGRVPDSIRLRRRSGGQGWDSWYQSRNSRQRYLDEIEALPASPIIGEWVSANQLRERVAAWPWGQPSPEHLAEFFAVTVVLGLAAYCREMSRQLRVLGG